MVVGEDLLLHRREVSVVGHGAGGVVVTGEADVPTQRDPADPPLDITLVPPFENGAAKADREFLDMQPPPQTHDQMAKFVNENAEPEKENHRNA